MLNNSLQFGADRLKNIVFFIRLQRIDLIDDDNQGAVGICSMKPADIVLIFFT